jgi:hypothetical protein
MNPVSRRTGPHSVSQYSSTSLSRLCRRLRGRTVACHIDTPFYCVGDPMRYSDVVGGTPRRRFPPCFFNRRFFMRLVEYAWGREQEPGSERSSKGCANSAKPAPATDVDLQKWNIVLHPSVSFARVVMVPMRQVQTFHN